ncbi:MAG TPA: hypothetical protein VFI27_16710 [candidate division Zixibacteria bacterium]|nr:hypothetical protein [candidate division Zixibacteria bacterium]
MTTQTLYEEAGSPRRAVVKLSTPTMVYTGKRRGSKKTEFEAFITKDGLGYYFNPNSFRAFYMPDNVTEFVPIDTMDLWYRARKAAEHIKADRTHGRELDGAFENGDSDEMCAALHRLSLRSKKLAETLYKVVPEKNILEHVEKFSNLTDKELAKHAKQSREEGRS